MDYGLVIRVTEKTDEHQNDNQGPPIAGAVVSGTLEPATTDSDGNATLEVVRVTVAAPGFASYVDQPYHRPSLQGPVAVSLRRA
jgi:hypothetical protein